MTTSAPFVDPLQQARDVGRVVGEVTVHLHEDVEAVLDAPTGIRPGRRCPARLGRPAEDLNAPELARRRCGELLSPVGAGVVDDEDACVGRRLPRPAEDVGDVLRLVVGRQHDERPHLRRLYDPAIDPRRPTTCRSPADRPPCLRVGPRLGLRRHPGGGRVRGSDRLRHRRRAVHGRLRDTDGRRALIGRLLAAGGWPSSPSSCCGRWANGTRSSRSASGKATATATATPGQAGCPSPRPGRSWSRRGWRDPRSAARLPASCCGRRTR